MGQATTEKRWMEISTAHPAKLQVAITMYICSLFEPNGVFGVGQFNGGIKVSVLWSTNGENRTSGRPPHWALPRFLV